MLVIMGQNDKGAGLMELPTSLGGLISCIYFLNITEKYSSIFWNPNVTLNFPLNFPFFYLLWSASFLSALLPSLGIIFLLPEEYHEYHFSISFICCVSNRWMNISIIRILETKKKSLHVLASSGVWASLTGQLCFDRIPKGRNDWILHPTCPLL